MKKILILFVILSFSCSNEKSHDIKLIDGYWNMFQAEKNGKIIKDYKLNNAFDYFKIRKDSSGYRKKISPAINGTFLVSEFSSSFSIKYEKNQLIIKYENQILNSDEIIQNVSNEKLVLINSENYTLTYKRIKDLD